MYYTFCAKLRDAEGRRCQGRLHISKYLIIENYSFSNPFFAVEQLTMCDTRIQMGGQFEDGFIKVDKMWATIVDEEHNVGIDMMLSSSQKAFEERF